MHFSSRRSASWRRSGLLAGAMFATVVAGWLVWSVAESTAELAGPAAQDRSIAYVVSTLVSREHLTARPFDDVIADRAFKGFLKQLDPMKFYLLQSDVDEFAKRRPRIDDEVLKGDVRFAFDVFRRFTQRLDERVADIETLLNQPHDFTIDETMITDPEERSYASSPEQAYDFWRQRIKFDLLRLKADRLDAAADDVAQHDPQTGSDPLGSDPLNREVNDKPRFLSDVPADGSEATEPPVSPGDGTAAQARTVAAGKSSTESDVDKLRRRYHSFAERMHQIDSNELLEMYLTAFTTSFDPHTTYMSRDTLEDFQIAMRLNLEGIGAALEMEDGFTKVANVIPGGAADKAGELKSQDRIVSVGQGVDGALEEIIDMKLRDVVKKIRGPKGTVVRLGVIPGSEVETKIYSITREKIELEDSAAQSVILERGKKPNGAPYRLGVIDLPSFYMDMEAARNGAQDFKSTTRDVRHLLDQFNEQQVDLVILNLRRNGGGSLTEAIDLTGLFIDRGPVVQVKNSDGTVRPYDDQEPGMAWSGPLMVLTSKFSASASEILAGAVQDYSRALVVGDEATHGKGTVQSLLDLGDQMFPGISHRPNLGALKITIQQFYRPSGDSTQKRGVLADVTLPSVTSQMDVGEQDLDYAVEFDRVKNARYNRYNMVTEELVKELVARSAKRRGESEDFSRLDRDINRYRIQKDRKFITLNEEDYFQERKELDAEKRDEKEFKEQQVKSDRQVFESSYYNDEVLDIGVDYLNLLSDTRIAQVR